MTEADLIGWCTATGANNTVRQRMSTARTFLGWCLRRGLIDTDPSTELDRLKKQYPKSYGKVQRAHPARWRHQGRRLRNPYRSLPGRDVDRLLDQLALRLGLMGVRNTEAVQMTWGNLTADHRLVWIGKGRRQRTVTPGPTLLDLLACWRRKLASPHRRDQPHLAP